MELATARIDDVTNPQLLDVKLAGISKLLIYRHHYFQLETRYTFPTAQLVNSCNTQQKPVTDQTNGSQF